MPPGRRNPVSGPDSWCAPEQICRPFPMLHKHPLRPRRCQNGRVNSAVLINEAALLVCVIVGWFAGLLGNRWLAARRNSAGLPEDEVGRLGDVIGFVGGALGILLGLLLIFAVQHFADAKDASRNEAVASVGLFNASGPYPTAQRDALRHDLVCLMRSSATEDWQAGSVQDLTGAENTNAWALKVQQDVETLPFATDAQSSNHYFVTQELLEAGKARQMRLLYSVPDIPLAIWIVIYVCSLIFIGLLAFHMADRQWLARLSVTATYLVLVVIVGTLTVLDLPYSGLGASLQPVAMQGSLIRLQDAYPGDIWRPCEQLAVTTFD